MATSGTQLKSCREEEGRSVVADGLFHTITWAVRVNMKTLDALRGVEHHLGDVVAARGGARSWRRRERS